jgi:RND superfamily putative drug exporter
VVLAWVLLAVAMTIAAWSLGSAPSEALHIPGSRAEAVLDELQDRFPDQAGGRAVAVMSSPEGRLDAAPRADVVASMVGSLSEIDGVRTVIGPVGPAAPLLTSEDGRTAWAQIVFEQDAFEVPDETLEQVLTIGETAGAQGLTVGFGGQPFERVESESTRTGEMIGLAVALVVLLIAFGSVGAAALPLLLAALVVGIGYAATRLLAGATDMNLAAQAMGSMIGLAIGIDYALFVVTRYRQRLREGAEPDMAIADSIDTAGRSVLFAGGTVMVSLLGLVVVQVPVVTSMALAVSFTVAVAVVASLTLLPAALALLGDRIDAWRVPFTRLSAEDEAGVRPPLSARWARAVTRRPWPFLVGGAAVLVLLAMPVLSLETGWPDARHRPEGDPARVAFDLMTDAFGVGANAPLVLSVDSAEPAEVATVTEWVGGLDGVRSVSPAVPNPANDMVLLQVTPTTGPEEPATAELVERLRSGAGLDPAAPAVGVTGATAFYTDLNERMTSRLVPFIAAVVLMSLLLLTAVFRAPLVALKAAGMNLLGIAAAYGAVVAVFQWGWGRSLLGVDQSVPIVSSLPIVMFAVLFGLSMDYEVFIISRIREAWLARGDNTAAVVEGLTASSRVVTSAAVIMFAVFAGFTTADSIEIKMTGFGLAVAVLLDATIIRQVLVPASMTLLGRRNWWIPRWMDRLLPSIDVEGGARAHDPTSPLLVDLSAQGTDATHRVGPTDPAVVAAREQVRT